MSVCRPSEKLKNGVSKNYLAIIVFNMIILNVIIYTINNYCVTKIINKTKTTV